MERGNARSTKNQGVTPRTIRRPTRKGLHITHLPGGIEVRLLETNKVPSCELQEENMENTKMLFSYMCAAVASLAGRKYGKHKNVIFIHAQTLEEAEFKLNSSTKVSETSYKHCTNFPIHGTGQGSSNAPTIWCFISSVLFQCHNQ
jgi:hypothetical protein